MMESSCVGSQHWSPRRCSTRGLSCRRITRISAFCEGCPNHLCWEAER